MLEPATGQMRGGAHVLPLRVYYEDTDAGGIVYHANYLRYAERARAEVLRLLGVGSSWLRETHGLGFVARRCLLDYIAPARLDDALEVHTRMLEVGGASLRAGQVVKRAADDLVRIEVLIACVRGDGRPARMPAELRAALAPLVAAPGQ